MMGENTPQRSLYYNPGSNVFVGAGFKLFVDDEPLLSLDMSEDGRLLVSLDLYDAEDDLLLSIHRNEWITGEPLPWDLEFGHRWIRMRHKLRDITINIDGRTRPLTVEGDFWRRRQNFAIRRDTLLANGAVTGCGVAGLGLVCLRLRIDTVERAFFIERDPAYSRGEIVGGRDLADRLGRSEVAYRAILAQGNR